ncbi:MAG TPA: DinB family protein [Thermoanaerobaculia bacterium]
MLLSETIDTPMSLQTIVAESGVVGNLLHDAHIRALYRARGISELLTGDRDFRRFPLRVIDPFREALFHRPALLFPEIVRNGTDRVSLANHHARSAWVGAESSIMSRQQIGGESRMKRRLVIIAVLLVSAIAFADPPLTDNQKMVQELERTQSKFLKSIEGLSDAQWSFKPAPDRWSVAECAEHIAASEPFIRAMVAGVLAKEATPEMLKEGVQKDEIVGKGLVDRSQKFKAPEPLVPTNRFGTPAAAIEAFTQERAETIKLAASDADLRSHADKHFLFGPLDGYGWFLFLSAHSERHTLQIEEVRGHPDFPKK